MSYLDFPRIHFSGTFEAGPSTINNVASNYKPGQSPLIPVWNPNGNAYIKLKNCSVTQALTKMGGAGDPDIEGAPVTSTDNWGGGGVPAKIVDLDPEQQMVSMIYGLQLKFGSGDNSVTGEMTPVWFENYFGTNATYQSVLTQIEWGSGLTGTLKALKKASPDQISIKMVAGPVLSQVSNPDPNGSEPFICQIMGTIGPSDADAPINFVPARLMRPTIAPDNTRGRFNFGPAQVSVNAKGKAERLTIDLGSSAPNGSQTLSVSTDMPKTQPVHIGSIDFSPAAQSGSGLITDFDLSGFTDLQASTLQHGPITIRDGNGNVIFAESATGLYVNATPYVYRMEADTSAEVEFWATRFGQLQDVEIEIVVTDDTGSLLGPANPNVGKAGPNGSIVSFDPAVTNPDGSATVTTTDGRACLTIHGGNPDDFRQFIDGQVYAIGFNTDPETPNSDSKAFLSLLVHDKFDKAPTWANIQPIMQQYAVLYPVMKHLGIDLGDEQSMQEHAQDILGVFGKSFVDPAYMPVVRDLSDAKKAVITEWLKAQVPTG